MKQMKKLLSLLLVLCLVFSLTCTAFAAEGDDASMKGKTVILHSNDVHGAITGYAKIAQLKADYAAKGAEVILVDAGDYIQGTPEVSVSKGATAVQMMNEAGYDFATLGNHEFDFGYDNLKTIMKDAKFQVLCADVTKDGKLAFDAHAIVEKGGVKIGFFGVDTPESLTKVNPALIQGVSFPQGEELYKCVQAEIDALKADGADIIVCLSHLGVDPESEPNRSTDVYAKTKGIDIMLDGHSHTVMTEGENKEPVQSTGTKFANVGVVVIDNETKAIESHQLVKAEDIGDDADVLAAANKIISDVNEKYGAKFAETKVDLNGDRDPGNRTEETNLGDLIADAMLWSVLKEGELKVPDENVIAITNGGGIRASLKTGDITMKDINTVLPFGNTVAVIYVSGAELLEALEASTHCTPTAIGAFPQVAGIDFCITTDVAYDQGKQYPDSTYYGPKSIQRVIIDDVNGQAFDEEATYAVVTNNFCAAGGDTYYAFKAAAEQFDTSIPMDEAVMDYIATELKGVVDDTYAEPQGRIFIGTAEEVDAHEQDLMVQALVDALDKDLYTADSYAAVAKAAEAYDTAKDAKAKEAAIKALVDAVKALEFKPNSFEDVADDAWYVPAVDFAAAEGIMKGTSEKTFEPTTKMTRGMVATVLYRLAGEPSVEGLTNPYTDLVQDWYKDAVTWASAVGVTKGTSETTFSPESPITREQMATMIIRFSIGEIPEFSAEEKAEMAEAVAELYTDGASVSDWAQFPVLTCYFAGVMQGDAEGTFRPQATLNRAECAQIMLNLYELGVDTILAMLDSTEEAPAETPAQTQALVEAFSFAA